MKFNANRAKAGENVTVTTMPDDGYKEIGITVVDAKGNVIPVTKNDDGTYTFTMPDTAVTVTPVFEEITEFDNNDVPDRMAVTERFTDVNKDDWYLDAAQWAVDSGLMYGVSENEFAPSDIAARAMVVTMLWRIAGMPAVSAESNLTDVDGDAWYADAVAWAVSAGVVSGISDTEFSPDTQVTREQLAAILYRYAKNMGEGFTGAWAFPLDFTDAANVSEYAYEPLCFMTMKGVIAGMGDGTLAPKENATRAQIAAIFKRFAVDSLR